MKEAGLTDVQTSINRRQNTVAQYISTRPLLDLCEGSRQREGERVTLRWWEQSVIDWEKAKAKETETKSTSGVESGADMEGEEGRVTGGAAGAAVWGGDVGGVPDDGAGAERIYPWGGEKAHGQTAA